MELFKIIFIGAGNVAHHLGLALQQKGHTIVQIFSRTKPTELAQLLSAEPVNDLKEIHKDADVYIIAVKDDAIEQVVRQIPLSDKLLIHTAGSVSMDVLAHNSIKYGVLYPLQTFSKAKVMDFSSVPLLIDGNTEQVRKRLNDFAQTLSDKVIIANDQQRLWAHLAAVFACNFTNHLLTVAEKLLNKQGMELKLLFPLIQQTIEKAKKDSPMQLQTGPAIRGDEDTMKKHQQLLKGDEDLKQLYVLLSESIGKTLNNVK